MKFKVIAVVATEVERTVMSTFQHVHGCFYAR